MTIAEALREAEYFTIATGKWHVGSAREHWPCQRGFDRCLSTPEGGGFYFKPIAGRTIIRNNDVMYDHERTPTPEGWCSTDAWTDAGIEFIGEALQEKKPFFLYLAHNAPHYPLPAEPQEIARHVGKYMKGWDKVREERHARQIALRIVDKSCPLPPRGERIPAWDRLDEKTSKALDLRMAIYAAVTEQMDRSVGRRLVEYLKNQNVLDNTLILFLSDNGGCDAGGILGGNGRGTPGSAESDVRYGMGWANASNTPFRYYKMWEHEGGIATPLIAHWPVVIGQGGKLTDQVGHVIDLMATCVDVSGATYPNKYHGRAITPLEGKSLAPIFRGKRRVGHEALYWEHEGWRAIRAGKWKLVPSAGRPWELYDIEADRTEMRDLARERPELVR